MSSAKLSKFSLMAAMMIAIFLIAMGFTPAKVLAQNSNSTSATPTPGPSPTAIAISGINSEADRTSTRIREIRTIIDELRVPLAVATGIDAVSDEIKILQEEQAVVGGRLTLETIVARERDWQSIRSRISSWSSSLDSRTKVIDDRIAEIRSLRDRWTAAIATIEPTDAPADANANATPVVRAVVPQEVIDRANEIVAMLDDIEKAASDKRAEFLTAGVRISEFDNAVGTELSTLRQERERELANIFSRDADPIWAIGADADQSGFGTSMSRQYNELVNYLSRHPRRLATHGIVLGSLMLFLFWVRRKIAPLVEEEPKLKRASAFFQMPIAAAIVLSILFVPFVYIQPPRILFTILSSLAIVPVILILRRIIEYPISLLLYGLIGLNIVDRFRDLLVEFPSLSRIIFSAEMLAACAFLFWFYRSKRVERSIEAGSFTLYSYIRRAIPFAIAVLGTALAANIFGFGSLSFLIGNGVLRTCYAAILIYTLVQILSSGIAFLLRVRPLSLLGSVKTNRVRIRLTATRGIKWLGVFLWILTALSAFSIRDFVYDMVAAIIGFTINIGEIGFSVGDVLFFGLTIWIAVLISRFIRFVLQEDIFPRMDLGSGASYAISSVIHYLLLISGFLIAIAAVGFELSRFAIVAGAIGLGLGFGLQTIINNFVSGLILLFEQPIKVGDTVQIGQHMGSLMRIGLRASVVRKVDGSDVIVPNSKLVSDEVINWTMLDERRRIDIPVGVAYGSDPKQVSEILISVTRGHEEILTDPSPRALFLGMGDSSLDFELRFWTDESNAWVPLRSEIVTELYQALVDADIEIPYPQQDLNVRTVDEKILASVRENMMPSVDIDRPIDK